MTTMINTISLVGVIYRFLFFVRNAGEESLSGSTLYLLSQDQ